MSEFNEFSYQELQKLCKESGINASGTKEELIAKLEGGGTVDEPRSPASGASPTAHGEAPGGHKAPSAYFEKADGTNKTVVPRPVIPTNMLQLSDINDGLKVNGIYELRPGFLVRVVAFDKNHKDMDTVRFKKGKVNESGIIDWVEGGVPMLKEPFEKWLKQASQEVS